MEIIVKRIIWIDENVQSKKIQFFLDILKTGIEGAQFYLSESVEKAFQIIKNTKENIILSDGTLKEDKIFQFRLFYVIISGSLSNNYFSEYVKATKELPILAANIIFCLDESKNKMKAYYLDEFLNPGKVYNEDSIDKIVEYINKDESNFSNDSNLLFGNEKKEYKPQEEQYGNVFFIANNISDITYPYYFAQMINSSFITEFELESFQCFLMDYYPELKDLIFPAREKKIDIPYYLLAKFYLRMYTNEKSNFFKNMNFDLSNDKFDLYRVYIFLLFNALNKKTIKSCYNRSLFRGTVLSKSEFEKIEKALNNKRELDKINELVKNKNEINTCLYYSKTFLSFSKNINMAKGYINKGNDELIPVLFEIKGLDIKFKNDDFVVTNLDLVNISEFNEEEVLFLPFSCFDLISIKDEEMNIFGEIVTIKKIELEYLYKYKKYINEYIHKIKEKEQIAIFLRDVINSAFSNEISEKINCHNFDIKKKFQEFLSEKYKIKKEFLTINNVHSPLLFNCIFKQLQQPRFLQKIKIDNIEGIRLKFQNEKQMIITKQNNKLICYLSGGVENFFGIGEKIYFGDKNNNNLQNEIVQFKNKNSLFLNNCFFTLYTVGIEIGDYIANYENIKDEPLMVKLKKLGNFSLSLLAPFISDLFSPYMPNAIFNYAPIIMGTISINHYILSIADLRNNIRNFFSPSEIYSLMKKRAYLVLNNLSVKNIIYGIGAFGFNLLMCLQIGSKVVIALCSLGLGVAVGFGSRKLEDKKIINEDDQSDSLVMFSEHLYYQYIPKKFKEWCFPTFTWKGVSNKVQSFAIELVEDGNRKWLIINIKKWIRKLSIENYRDVGDTIIEYKGVSKHPNEVTFILYELGKETFKPEEWGVGKNVKENYKEEIMKYFNQVVTLDVF